MLGEDDAIGHVMLATALEYRDVVRMLAARGTPAFYEWSRKLYGSPKDKFPDGRSTVRGLGQLLYGVLTNVDEWSDGGSGGPAGVPARRTCRSSTREPSTPPRPREGSASGSRSSSATRASASRPTTRSSRTPPRAATT